MSESQSRKAESFRAMHGGPGILVLPNAWDAASARVLESAGFGAVGTSSAGVANSLGYADGQNIPRDEALFVLKRICSTVSVPVTADIEAGYGVNSVAQILETVRGVLEAGAVGINLEDADGAGLSDTSLQAEKIRAVRELGSELGVPIVINARTDAFHLDAMDDARKFDLAVERANAYRAAGADSLFVPFVTDGKIIGRLAKAIDGPMNVLVTPGSPSIEELAAMGVRRVSVGSGLHRATMGLVRSIAAELRDNRSFEPMIVNQISYAEMNALVTR